jgi:hypothetical protein
VSDFGDVPTAILAAVDGAITLGAYHEGAVALDKIAESEYPYAMTYNPVKRQARGDLQHGEEVTITPLIVVWINETIANVNAAIVLIEAALDGSTLGGVVKDTWVAEVIRYESTDSPRIAVDFEIQTLGFV